MIKHTNIHRVMLLLAAVILAASLSGCGKDKDLDEGSAGDIDIGNTNGQPQESAYTAERISLPEELSGSELRAFCHYEGYLYFVRHVSGDPEKLYKLSVDGLSLTELTAFEPLSPEGGDGHSRVLNIAVDRDGNIWLAENLYLYDADSGGETALSDSFTYIRVLDQVGAEVKRIDVTTDIGNAGKMCIDKDGNICVWDGDTSIKVVGADGIVMFELETPNNGGVGSMLTLTDGSAVVCVFESRGTAVKAIDTAAKSWGKTYTLGIKANDLYSGTAEYDFFCNSADSLYGVDLQTQTTAKLLNWLDSGVNNPNDIRVLAPTPDGGFFCLTQDWSGEKTEILLLKKKDPAEVESVTVLTLACYNLDPSLRSEILEFNSTNEKCRIEVTEYSQYFSGNDGEWSSATERLAFEIISGKVPDILVCGGFPYRQWIDKGLFEDLYSYIDSDPELSRSDFVESVMKALEIDGKLYQASPGFSVDTVMANPDTAGPDMGWTLDELFAFYETLPSGARLFDMTTKMWMLEQICRFDLDSFVNRKTGECFFDGDDFIKLLEFANTFPLDYEWSEGDPNVFELIQSGEVVLMECGISDFSSIQMFRFIFGGELVFKGYPSASRNGHAFQVSEGTAISSTCKDKDAAWQFLRRTLTSEYQLSERYWGFPTNKEAFEAMIADAMTPEYYTDENGELVQRPKYSENFDSVQFDCLASTQEDIDLVMELIDSTNKIAYFDSDIMKIVEDEADIYFHGDKSAKEAAAIIQSRVSILVNEQR